jgi:hypothetical protein
MNFDNMPYNAFRRPVLDKLYIPGPGKERLEFLDEEDGYDEDGDDFLTARYHSPITMSTRGVPHDKIVDAQGEWVKILLPVRVACDDPPVVDTVHFAKPYKLSDKDRLDFYRVEITAPSGEKICLLPHEYEVVSAEDVPFLDKMGYKKVCTSPGTFWYQSMNGGQCWDLILK